MPHTTGLAAHLELERKLENYSPDKNRNTIQLILALPPLPTPTFSPNKRLSLYFLSALYIAAGIYHFWSPQLYVSIMPSFVPYPFAMVLVSGMTKIILGTLVLFNTTRRMAAYGIILLLVLIFPANVQMLVNYVHQQHPYTWLAAARLPLQIPLIWWAWKVSKL